MFLLIELVRSVHIVADMGDGHLGAHPIRELIIFLMYRKLLLSASGAVEFLHQRPHLLFHLVEIHPLIRHVLEFHMLLLFSCFLHPTRLPHLQRLRQSQCRKCVKHPSGRVPWPYIPYYTICPAK